MEATPSPATARPAKKASPLGSPRFYGSSPTFRTRLDEKETLQNLNDRFAVYIERMRTLEERNSTLSAEITSWKEKEKSEVSEVKTMFESELANARVLLDEISKEKSRVELENNRNVTLAADLLKKLEAEKAARKKADDKCAMLDRKLNDKEASLSTLQSEYNKLKERYDSLTLENKNLSSALDSTQYDLEQKTLDKVDLENRIQTLTEDLDFKKRTYEQELAEIRTQVSSVETSRVYMETDYKQKYDTIMKDKLQELRDEFEEEAENVKKDVENTYKHKIDDLKGNTEKTRHECNRQIIIIRDLRSTIDTLKIEKNVSETEVISLKKRVEDLENLRLRERDDLTKQLNDKIDEIKDLNDRIDEMQKEYEELMGIKVALDLEISAYRKLLEGEEERLNITPTTTPSRKRPRTDSDAAEQPVLSTAKGSIQISECDPTGNFVKLANTGGNEEPLGGWVVRRAAADQPPVEFKFNPRSILKAGAAVAIWSACSGMKHKPPTDLVMKTADWGPGPDAVTTLHNSEGEVVAQMTETSPTDIGTRAGLRRKRRADKNESCIIS